MPVAFALAPTPLKLLALRLDIAQSLISLRAAMVSTRGAKVKGAPSATGEDALPRAKRPRKVIARPSDDIAEKRAEGERRYYLFKSEPESRIENGIDMKFGIEDLMLVEEEPWDGVRNFEARNHMQSMRVGDLGFFYVRLF
jgi:EVE domain